MVPLGPCDPTTMILHKRTLFAPFSPLFWGHRVDVGSQAPTGTLRPIKSETYRAPITEW